MTSSTMQRGFVVALLLFFVVVSVHYSLKAVKHRSAILRWYEQIQSMEDGENVYERFNYPNPPIMGLVLSPLTRLPPLVSALVWFYAKVAMTLLAFFFAFRMIETPEQPFPAWAKATTVLLSLWPIVGDLEHGNVNLFIMFLVIAGLYLVHVRRDISGGILIALAAACKVTPALFVPYFIWKRAWKSLAGCLLGSGLFLWVIPGLCLGWSHNQDLLASWVNQMVKPYVMGGVVTSEHVNQSLPGLVYRLTTESPSFSTYVDDVYRPLEYHQLVNWDKRGASLLVKCLGVIFCLLFLWVGRTPLQQRVGWRLAAEYSLVFLGMLLFSERTWKHHCVTLLLPVGVLCYYLATCEPSRRLRAYLIGSLALVVLLMVACSTDLVGERFAKLAQVYGSYVVAYALLLGALVVLLRKSDRSPAEQDLREPALAA